MKQVEVVAIIHDTERCILTTQRWYGEWTDYWKFPGNKINLVRQLMVH